MTKKHQPKTQPRLKVGKYGLARKSLVLAIVGRIRDYSYQNHLLHSPSYIIQETTNEGKILHPIVEKGLENSPTKPSITANYFNLVCGGRKKLELQNFLSDINVQLIGSEEFKDKMESKRITLSPRSNKVSKINDKGKERQNRQRVLRARNRPRQKQNEMQRNNNKIFYEARIDDEMNDVENKEPFIHKLDFSYPNRILAKNPKRIQAEYKERVNARTSKIPIRNQSKRTNHLQPATTVNHKPTSPKQSNEALTSKKPEDKKDDVNAILQENLNSNSMENENLLEVNEENKISLLSTNINPKKIKKSNTAVMHRRTVSKIRQEKRLQKFCQKYIKATIQQKLMILNGPKTSLVQKYRNHAITLYGNLMTKTRRQPYQVKQDFITSCTVVLIVIILYFAVALVDPYFWPWVNRRLKFCYKCLPF